MAGYIFSMDDLTSIENCFINGLYGTILNDAKNNLWNLPHEGTFADYSSMKEGDYIFFFTKRKIYGVGKLKNIYSSDESVFDCKFLNFPKSDEPKNEYSTDITANSFLGLESTNQRYICSFEPAPGFFKDGIDMDDALSSNPSCFRMLRAFWKLSFIKLDDNEAECLFHNILKRNYFNSNGYASNYNYIHNTIKNKLSNCYLLTSKNILKYAAKDDKLKHEMAIEAGIIDQLTRVDSHTTEIFGKWDYISHQVVASPFKAIDYMDKIDIFGYSYIEGFKAKNKYLVMELKKDKANKDDVAQLLKYVDWVKDEYAEEDYSSINAFLVAYDFEIDLKTYIKEFANRSYTIGRRPIVSGIWNDIKLVQYRFDETENRLNFMII